GEGTLEVLNNALGGEWHEADVPDAFARRSRARWLELPHEHAVVEAAEAIPLDPERLDPLAASSRGLGELIRAVGHPPALPVGPEPRSRPSVPSWCPERLAFSTSSVSTRRRSSWSSQAREPWTPRRCAARRPGRWCGAASPPECGASSSAGGSSRRSKV